MNKASDAFVAFPTQPAEIGHCINSIVHKLEGRLSLSPWEQNDIAGRPLVAPIFEGISQKDILIADITSLNFNVTYEIGYSIGVGKRAYLIKHLNIEEESDQVSRVGIFDTLGYESYRDSNQLFQKLCQPIDITPIPINPTLDSKAPMYILETPIRTEGMNHILSRVKKARVQFRSYSPTEHSRLAATDAIQHVANSFGVLIPLLPNNVKDSQVHNIRAAFIAGLSHGMQKPTLILQSGESPVPLDVRDFVVSWTHHKDIDECVEILARDIFEGLQTTDNLELPETGLLPSLSFGDPMAENEFQTLRSYFLATDQYQRTLRREVNLVVGRKGTGKTALFSQVRDRIRRDKQNIVVDLKPEGYQLVKLKEEVLKFLSQGAKQHLVTAFWEYLLYLEVCYKVLEKDHEVHLRNHNLTNPYRELSASYYRDSKNSQGDFSERLQYLSDHISTNYASQHGEKNKLQLTSGEVTSLIHRQDLAKLMTKLSHYLSFKSDVCILFDNLDRGWSAHGLSEDDILIVRALIDASRKVQRSMQKHGHKFNCVIFLRNDVYQLLMDESSDFGKETRASLDWSDSDQLRELVRKRIASNESVPKNVKFDQVWRQICVSHVDGCESSQYLIERSLMRPRNLLRIIAHCRGSAINLHHSKIEEEDIHKGMMSYSTDLLIDIDQELTDIDELAKELIYVFRKEQSDFNRDELEILFELKKIPLSKVDRIIDFLLYYGFLGLRIGTAEPEYIHDVGYDMKIMRTSIQKHANALLFVVNPAFWPALSISQNS